MCRKKFQVTASDDIDYPLQIVVLEDAEVCAVMPLYVDELRSLFGAVADFLSSKADQASLAHRVKVAANCRPGLSSIADALNDSIQGTNVVWHVTDSGELDYYVKADAPEHSEVSLDD